MKRIPQRHRRTVKVLSDPKPSFVSLVASGANGTPLRVVKMVDAVPAKPSYRPPVDSAFAVDKSVSDRKAAEPHERVRRLVGCLPQDAVDLLSAVIKAEEAAPGTFVQFDRFDAARHLDISPERVDLARNCLIDQRLLYRHDDGCGHAGYGSALPR